MTRFLLLSLLGIPVAIAGPVPERPATALVGVKLIDGTGAPARLDQTVLLVDGHIAAVGDRGTVTLPPQVRILELAGHTVIPGLVGTHNHLHMPRLHLLARTAPRLYLASGVTTIQTAGAADPAGEQKLAEAIENGRVPGPEVIRSGPYFTGEGGSGAMVMATDEDTVRAVIDRWVDRGVRWFKVYRHATPDQLATVIRLAHARGARVAGHLCAVTYTEAAELGIDAIEHGFIHAMDHAAERVPGTCSGTRDFRSRIDLEGDEVRAVQQALIDHGVAVTTTPAILEAQVPERAVAQQRALRVMAPSLVRAYEARRRRMRSAGDEWHFKPDWLTRSLAWDLAFFRAGGLLTAGVDPGLHNLPGFGDQRNFELLVEAGFRPIEAVQVMTANGARALGRADIGVVAPGRRADLVVIRGDLEADAALIREVQMVFKAGTAYDPSALLEEVWGRLGR